MKTYIISMNVDEELAEDAALALNGQVFTLSNKLRYQNFCLIKASR